MRRLIRTAAIAMICGALCMPQITARGRNNNNQNNGHKTEQRRPQNNSHQSNSRPASRPGNNGNNHNSGNRPGNNGNGSNHQPNRPSAGQPSRPQHPQYNGNHNNRPAPGNHHYTPGPPPHRPNVPVHRPWHRPTPPPAYRPAPGWRPIHSILGVALGSAINFTVNALVNAGYVVAGYGSDAVYVSNVPMLNMNWPDATLYYGSHGLYASEFIYSTTGFDLNRYNRVYNTLVQSYGYPVQTSNANGIISSTWWGTGNQFIRLTYHSGIAANGTNRFFTTLSFGN